MAPLSRLAVVLDGMEKIRQPALTHPAVSVALRPVKFFEVEEKKYALKAQSIPVHNVRL